jgi:ribosome-binding factor A
VAGNRPDRVGEQIRIELSELLAREVHDPGVGFITLTTVKVSPDLQLARVYYTSMGDEKARRETAKALQRATPFLRRQVAQRLRLRRAPELQFFYDESIAHQDRIEQILQELKADKDSRGEE